jgi:hypothetical protein
MIGEPEVNDHNDEHFLSQAFPSRSDDEDQTFAVLRHQHSDDDMYHSVKSDDDHASPLAVTIMDLG